MPERDHRPRGLTRTRAGPRECDDAVPGLAGVVACSSIALVPPDGDGGTGTRPTGRPDRRHRVAAGDRRPGTERRTGGGAAGTAG